VTACAQCNLKKGGRTLQKAQMHLRHVPREPRPTASYRFGTHLAENESWEPYLEVW
jgi:5-methylcytosine-specific restriction endonuclease McrA